MEQSRLVKIKAEQAEIAAQQHSSVDASEDSISKQVRIKRKWARLRNKKG